MATSGLRTEMEEALEQSSDDGGKHSPPPDEHNIEVGFIYEIDDTSLPPNLNAVGDLGKEGWCRMALMGTGMSRWGFRRRVQFIGRHPENEILIKNSSVNSEEAEEEEDGGDEKENRLLITDAAADDGESKRRGSKRLSNLRGAKMSKKKQKGICGYMVEHGNSKRKLRNLKDRWSEARYRVAEESIAEVLREKKAVFGSPILRQQLRLEARKKIGDTGLLDHLLKHVAGKVAPGGTDRFRRRHNADGAIEYWLEKADLVNLRKEAGIEDPYWSPPLGWQLGDNPHLDPICAKELRLIKHELATLRRDMEEHLKEGIARDSRELEQLKEELTQIKSDVQELTSQRHQECQHQDKDGDSTDVILLALKAKKAKVEKQLMEVAHCLNQLEEEIERGSRPRKSESGLNRSELKEPYSEDEIRSRGESEVTEDEAAKEASDDQNEETARQRLKSGFRVCRPRATFCWPTTAHNHPYPLVVAPTPPPPPPPPPTNVAASSSSAARPSFTPPPPLFLPYVAAGDNPPSPSERRAVKVATVTDVTAGVGRRRNIIDLNEDPPAPMTTAPLTLPRIQYAEGGRIRPSNISARGNTGLEGCSNTVMGHTLTLLLQEKLESPPEVGTWLGMAAPNQSNSNRG